MTICDCDLSDVFMVFEEIDGDDDIREEFPRPFCSEYFDIVGLCIHLDKDHQVEAKNGVLCSSNLSTTTFLNFNLLCIKLADIHPFLVQKFGL